MAKVLRGGDLTFVFDERGEITSATGSIAIGSTDDVSFAKSHSRPIALTTQQRTALEAFVASMLTSLRNEETV